MLEKFQKSSVVRIYISRFHAHQKVVILPNRFKIQRIAGILAFSTYLCRLLMDSSLHFSNRFLARPKVFSYPCGRQLEFLHRYDTSVQTPALLKAFVPHALSHPDSRFSPFPHTLLICADSFFPLDLRPYRSRT